MKSVRALPGELLRRVLLSAVLATAGTTGHAQPTDSTATPRTDSDAAQVLVVTGTDPYLPAFVAIDAAMREAVARQSRRRVQWLYEHVDTIRFAAAPDQRLAELLARKYEGTRIDAIVTLTEAPAEFYLQFGAPLWPGVPVVLNWVSQDFVQRLPVAAEVAVILGAFDYEGTLRIAFALQPQAQRVLIIAGASPFDRAQLASAQAALAKFPGRAEVETMIGEDPKVVGERLAREPTTTIALYSGVLLGADRRSYVPRNYLREIVSVSRIPVYGAVDTYMGNGIAAGSIESFRERGAVGAEALMRMLSSPRAAGPVVLPTPPSRCMSDARELARFGLSARRLPEGCEVRYQEASFLRRYWWQTLLVALVLGAQSGLIAALLLQRRRRRAAELGFAVQRLQLLHASRLAVAGELTASIAHEINQPLGAILSNADAAEMLVQTGRLERGELLQILADIKRDDLRASEVIKRLRSLLARHEVEHHRFAVHQAIADSVAILGAEARRRGASVDIDLQATKSSVTGDPVQFQQVMINLIINAFDASAVRPAGERRVLISTVDAPDGVRILIRDFGQGIAPGDLPRLFDSFFTTKSGGMGLGLSIARSIVEAHGGTLTASNAAVGAEFCITLPTAPDLDAAQPATTETT
jgi:signal transduction histidine kinase